MKTKQQMFGDKTEQKIAKLCFKKNGFWCYITPKKISGQPVDIVAMKNGENWLVDAKHIEPNHTSFPFSYIQPNQIDTMTYAKTKCGIKNLGFVISNESEEDLNYKIDDFRPLFLSFDKLTEITETGRKSAKISELEDFMEVLKNDSKD